MTWLAVHTRARAEPMVARLLRSQGYDVLWLHYWHRVRHARRTWLKQMSLYPRYLFAAAPACELNSTAGVSTVVYCGDRPVEIPPAVIEEERAKGDRHGCVDAPKAAELQRQRHSRGDVVRLLDGPLAGLLALVALDSGKEVRVWLEMFGGKVEALTAPEGLESVSPERGFIRIPPRKARTG